MTSTGGDRDQTVESGTALSALSDSRPTEDVSNQETVKRSAAKHRIELYHCQLLKGCGDVQCTNQYCASSPQFCFKDLDNNSAAAKALEMFKKRAPLCCEISAKKTVKKADEVESVSGPALAPTDQSRIPATSMVALTSSSSKTRNYTDAEKPKSPAILTEKKLLEVIELCRQAGYWNELNRYLGLFFNPESVMCSFPLESDVTISSASKELLRSIEYDRDKDFDEQEQEYEADNTEINTSLAEEVTVNSARRLGSDFAKSGQGVLSVDIASVRRSFAHLFSIPESPFQSVLVNAIVFLTRDIETDLRSSKLLSRREEFVNLFLIIMEIPCLGSPEFLEAATPQLCKTVGLLADSIQARLTHIWSTYDTEHLTAMVECIQQFITVRIVSEYQSSATTRTVHDDDAIIGAVKLLKILYFASALGGLWDSHSPVSASPNIDEQEARESMLEDDNDDLEDLEGQAFFARLFGSNRRRRVAWEDPLQRVLGINLLDCRKSLVPPDEFVNEPLSEIVEMDKDFLNYRASLSGEKAFAFMLHPFVLTPTVKNVAMYFDNRIQMMSERRAAILQGLMGDQMEPPQAHLKLRVRRDHLIDDALVNLEMIATDNPQDLKKQLFVEFEGEQGIDEGGPSKEFFQLIIEELFNPDIGMFSYCEETRLFWFNSVSFETEAQYKLIGILLGLAIYNNVILDVHFPMVVYRKLMGRPGTFEDLKVSHPILARSLQEMLDYEGDVATDFMQPFCIGDVDVFGHSHVHQLKENGDQIIVSNDTRQEFVDLYADYLLNKSIERQFSAFRHGFNMVTDESPLQLLFRPDEIELLICGIKNYDFNDLERSTQYDGGYTTDTPTVKYFWETVHELSEDQKHQLLQFTTGSDRVPVGGLSQLKMVIARNGPDSDRLPTAHTCFNVLLLPEYATKNKLRDRLLKAITYSKGFGML